MKSNEALLLGRAKNAVLTFLEQRLVVPKIYIDAVWNDQHVDVLAIDRDGVGDVHLVSLVGVDLPKTPALADVLAESIQPILDRFYALPGQYKYVAVVDIGHNGSSPLPGLPHHVSENSFSPDGIGRVGFVSVYFSSDDEARVQLMFKPERFRAKIAKLADEYVQQHEADWEIRA